MIDQALRNPALADSHGRAMAFDLDVALAHDVGDRVECPFEPHRRVVERELALAGELVIIREQTGEQTTFTRGHACTVLDELGVAALQ